MNAFDQLFVGQSPELHAVLRAARLVAGTDVPLLIGGESGTGKELLARAVHAESSRASRPFVSVNCAALPENLAESLLYGHRKGAFTGAVSDQQGHIPAASGGTLFLDEVGELPLSVQAKLLRFLESGECLPVGQSTPVRVDVRIVAATNRDLYQQVKAGRFREDLYYRLHVVPLELPPLRERSGDIAVLLQHLTSALAERHELEPPRFAPATMELLQRYPWPGNVRELRNFCERTVVLHSGRDVGPTSLPHEMQPANRSADLPDGFTLPETGIRLDELEAQMMKQALARTRGNRSRAARLLGLTRDTLLYRMKKHAIEA